MAPTKSNTNHLRPAKFIQGLGRLSDRIVAIEKPCVALLVGGIFLIVLINLLTRSLGWALFWADELAVYLMIWAALLGASTSVRLQTGIAVQLLTDYLPVTANYFVRLLVDSIILLFALVLIGFCWIWYDPWLLFTSGFDITEFKNSSYNFIYHEPTTTLQVQKFWVWLIVPVIAITMSIHACANVLERLQRFPGKATEGGNPC